MATRPVSSESVLGFAAVRPDVQIPGVGALRGVRNGKEHTDESAWGGYVLFEAATPEATRPIRRSTIRRNGHQFKIAFEPVVNMDTAFSAT